MTERRGRAAWVPRRSAGFVPLLGLLTCTPVLQAQVLVALQQSAQSVDPAVAAAQAQVRAAEQRVVQAKAGFGPSAVVTANTSDTRYREGPDFNLRPFSAKQAALQITQPLFRPALLPALDIADAQLLQAQAALRQAQLVSAVRLIEASFDVLRSRDAITFIEAQRRAAKEQLLAAQRSFAVGTSAITDVREAEARIDTVSAQMSAAESELELHQQLLADLAGRPAPELLNLGITSEQLPSLQRTSVLKWVAEAQLDSPEVQQAKLALEVAEAEVRKAWYGHAPTAEATYTYTMSSDSGTVTSFFPRRGDSSQIGVNVNIPLFASGATQARVKEALALRDKAMADVETARRSVQVSVRQSFSATLSAAALAQGLQTADRSLALSLRANRRGYEVGMKVNAEVLDAQARLFEARRDMSKARYDAWQNYIKLKASAGRLTLADLGELDGLLQPAPAPSWQPQPAVRSPTP